MINHEFTITGASTVFLRLAAHLKASGHSISLLPGNPTDGPMQQRFVERGIPIVDKAVSNDFDLVIANTISTAAHVIKLGAAARTIWFLHETEIGLRTLLKKPELAAAFSFANAVIYQTEFQREVYRSFTYGLDPAKFHIVPNGIDIDIEQISATKISAKTKKFRVVQVGAIEPRKRPGDLIRAAARGRLDIEVIFCGKFYALDEAAAKLVADAPETYQLLGETTPEETLAWIASSDIFCLASASESQPISVFEAALLSRPIIVSDLPAYRDVFVHGRNCLMFPPGYVELLALSLQNYIISRKLREDMGNAAQRTASRFSNAAFLSRFDNIIKALTIQ